MVLALVEEELRKDELARERSYRRGVELLERGKCSAAVKKLTEAIVRGERAADAHAGRADAYYRLRKYREALTDYEKALELNYEHPELLFFSMACAKEELGDLEGALGVYSAIIEDDPDEPAAYNNRGRLYFERGRLEDASADFEAAIALDPGYSTPYFNRGNLRAARGDVDGGADDIRRAAKLNPEKTFTDLLFHTERQLPWPRHLAAVFSSAWFWFASSCRPRRPVDDGTAAHT